MKKLSMLLMATLVTTISYAQEERELSKKVATEFERLYNDMKYEALFDMFSPEMKTTLPHDQAITFLQTLNTQAGALLKREFVNYPQGNVALYKSFFERGVVALYLSADENEKIDGMLVKPYPAENLPTMERNTSSLILPFNEEWTVFWGGDTEDLNYHVATPSQRGAFDLVITDANGKSFKNEGHVNEDYYAFGKELIAPVSGEVVQVITGIHDNPPGKMNPANVTGNTVVIKTANNEYLLFAHFKQHSIKVKQGDQVAQGQLLGLCGNSGNSSEPHLHFHIQNAEEMSQATGVKCYFDEIKVNGEVRKDYSPIQGERIAN